MRLSEIFEADQVKAKEKKPKKVKPNMGHQSPHPYQGRLVGESVITLEDDQDFHEEFGYLAYDEEGMFEAEYQGRKLNNKPMQGDVKVQSIC